MPAELKAQVRKETGKKAKRVRATGQLPAVLYGKGRSAMTLQVDRQEFIKIISSPSGINTIITLAIPTDGGSAKEAVITYDLQKDCLTDEYIHADFKIIALAEKMRAKVPVVMIGEAPGAKEGGIVVQTLREIEVECLPLDIPAKLEIDISTLAIGNTAAAGTIKIPDKVTLITSADEAVVSVVAPMKEEEVVAEAVVAAEVTEPELIRKEKPAEEGEEGEAKPAAEKEKAAPDKAEKPAREKS